jgi:hypothetical protein
MPGSLIDADSLMSVDVGTISTRAALFDVVEGRYRFIAAGQAQTTAAAPYTDISEGVRQAIENLQTVTGQTFLTDDHRLIIPTTEGLGVDSFSVTLSAGPTIKTVLVGLLQDVSLESVQRLARSIYTRVVDTLEMNDPRKPEQQIDSLLRLQPELFLIAGGTDAGATHSVQRLLETIGLACQLLPVEKQPAILFAGNNSLAEAVKNQLQAQVAALSISPNLRPTIEHEDLQPAQQTLAGLYNQVRRTQMKGVDELNAWAGNTLMPTSYALGRVIRFLSQGYDPGKGILGVDLGASALTVAAAFSGDLTLGVYPQLGLGEGLANLLRYSTLEDIARWIQLDLPAEAIREYLFTKSLYPASLPATLEDLTIEQAIARQNMQLAMNKISKDFSRRLHRPAPGRLPYFDPLLAAGSVITRAPTLGQSLLLLLDGLQPAGIANLILDQNNLLPALGAAASRNTLLPVQVLESGALLPLATVVAPYVNARPGTPILQARLVYPNGKEKRVEVLQGTIEVLPLPMGQAGRLYLKPLHHADVGLGPGQTRREGIPVTGAALGVIIDGRGRPVRLPADPNRRRELLKKWQGTVGG